MRTEIKSLLDARGFAVEVVTEAGHITGASPDMTKIQEVFNAFIKDIELPETTQADALNSQSNVRAFVFEQLVRLKDISGITVTAENAEMLISYIIGGTTLPVVSTPSA